MLKIITTAPARDDLAEIWNYIAKDKPLAATAFLECIDAEFQRLASSPRIGEVYRRRPMEVRRVSIGNYRAEEQTLLILRVLHGARRHRGLV